VGRSKLGPSGFVSIAIGRRVWMPTRAPCRRPLAADLETARRAPSQVDCFRATAYTGPAAIPTIKEERMSLIAWIVLGIIAGFLGSKIVNRTGEGLIRDLILGIVGAIVGGWLFSLFGQGGVTGLNLYSLVVAVVGAVVVLLAYHAMVRAA
jgi:uncharacterized membrane protein YeaQ/YmgE (transglycosylase-associated protein family)